MNNTNPDNTEKQTSLVDNIKNILNDFNIKLIFILVSLFVICNTFIINVIDQYIADGLLYEFNDNIAERILFVVVIAVLICYSYIDIYHNKKVSNAKAEWAFTALLFWAYYRFISTGWTYVKFWNLEHIYYVDIVSLFPLSIIIKKLFYKHLQYKPEGSNGFGLDIPINETDQDSFGRDDLAQRLATRIKNTNVQNYAFSIGIESPWGFGKTSFINLLCNHLDKDTVIIKFNPWNYEKERSLVDAFFSELRETLKVYDSSLSTKLTEYGNILSHSNHDTIKLSAEFINCLSSQSMNNKRNEINAAIKGIGKLILVVIDDLDRLDKDEIITVLKLIRNSANFPNMVFVSAYDREYLVETLKEDVYKSNIYLEKIFQYQFKLPEYDKSKLRDLLSKEGGEFVNDADKEEFYDLLGINKISLERLKNNIVLSNIDNPRDVYRFLNSLKFIYHRLQGEILIKDLMMIELIRIKYYDVYELLSKEHEKYLVFSNGTLKLWNENLDKDVILKEKHSDIFTTISNKYIEGGKDYNKIERLLKNMFNAGSRKFKAINNPSYIDRYFYYSLLDFDISKNDFKIVMKNPFDKIKQKIDVWLNDKKGSSLSDLLESVEFSNAEEYKKIVKSIFYVGYKTDNIFFNVEFIYSVIIKSPLTPEENKAFIYEVFLENGASEFVAKFIQDLFAELLTTPKLNLNEEECHNISETMLQLACDNNMSFENICKFLNYTSYFGHVDNHDGTYHLDELRNERADQIFISYVKSNSAKVLPQLIEGYSTNDAALSNLIFDIWKDNKNFVSFFNELFESNKEDKQLEEFVEFMNKYLSQEPLAPIQFDFKYINLNS